MKTLMIVGALAAMLTGPVNAETLRSTFPGETWYVDASAESGGSGTAERPFKTIAEAIGAASSGDVIEIGEGCYSRTNSAAALGRTNLYVDKRIYFHGRGRDKTIVRGCHDTGASSVRGTGAAAVRCVTLSGVEANGSVFDGIGFEAGATDSAEGNVPYFGGVYDLAEGVCFVDCAFRQCRAAVGAGVAGGTGEKFVRCLFDGNLTLENNAGAVLKGPIAGCYNCVFIRNGTTSVESGLVGSSTAKPFVNCTFIGNPVGAIPTGSTCGQFYNCIFLCSPNAITRGGMEVYYCQTDKFGTLDGGKHNFNTVNGGAYEYTNAQYTVNSPLTFDFRLVPGAGEIGSGNVEYLTTKTDWVPAEYVGTDYLGGARTTNGKVNRGAVEAVAPATDCAPTIAGGGLTIDGYTVGEEAGNLALWFRSSTWPCAFKVGGEGSAALFCFETPYGRRMPDRSDCMWYIPRRSDTITINWSALAGVSGVKTVSRQDATGGVKWADPNLQDYSQADGSREHPFKTLQAAINAVGDYGIVRALPGTYADGGAESLNGITARAVCSKNVRIEGVGGAEKTIVVGQLNNANEKTGANAVRGFDCASDNVTVGIGGFTITGCSTPRATESKQSPGFAGGAVLATRTAWKSQHEAVQVYDCIITNNWGFTAPALYSGWAKRCVIADNHQEIPAGIDAKGGAAAVLTILSSCLVRGNAANGYLATIGESSKVIGCTFHEPSATVCSVDSSSAVRVNNIFLECFTDVYYTENVQGNVVWKGSGSFVNYALKADPLFLNVATSDYRVLALSPAVTAGNAKDVNDFEEYTVGFLDGSKPIFGEGGSVAAGCCTPVACCVSAPGVSPSGTNCVDETGYVTFTPNFPRNPIGFKVNGEDVVTSSPMSFAWKPNDTAMSIDHVSAVYATNWYVNATGGNDQNSGFTPSAAKRTLAGIFEDCMILSGDVVHAAEGDYNDREMTNTISFAGSYDGGRQIGSRVCIPSGTSLVADGARSRTIIWGRWQSSSSRWSPATLEGCNVLRGVFLYPGASLIGFTVRNGATTSIGGDYDVSSGGCIAGPKATSREATGYVRDCDIFYGGARRAAGAFGCILDGCYIHECAVTSDMCATQYSQLENCLVLNASSTTIGSHYGIRSSTIVATSTVGVQELSSPNDSAVENSVIMVPNNTAAALTVKNWRNCFVNEDYTKLVFDPSTCTNITKTTLADCGLDKDNKYAPIAGSSVIDAGDSRLIAHYASTTAPVDMSGTQRVYNGQIDVGCHEYDWRETYALALRKNGDLAVTVATPAVFKITDEEKVCVPVGGVLSATWTLRRAKAVNLPVEMTGDGVLTVALDGTIVATITRSGNYSVNTGVISGPTSKELVFAYSSESTDACAVIGRMTGACGYLMMVR